MNYIQVQPHLSSKQIRVIGAENGGSIPSTCKNIKFERNKKGFPYIYKGENHLYYPDFYLPDTDEYVEIKGIEDDLWEAKKIAFPNKLIVYTKSEIKLLKKELEEGSLMQW